VRAFVDGGWGVDALLRRQSRPHADLDLVVGRGDVERALDALPGFEHDAAAWPGLPARLALLDRSDRALDLHLVDFDGDGNGTQVTPDGPCSYPAADLLAEGTIAGRTVRCVSAGLQLEHHVHAHPRDIDRADMQALAAACALELPENLR
jgi:lincosamide nucleotidyltransferase A/C/D/E